MNIDENLKNREIVSGTSIDEAIAILKANGFEIVYNEPIKYLNERYKQSHISENGESNRYIIMQNSKTGAIFQASGARKDNICYGDAEIVMCTRLKGVKWYIPTEQSNYIDGSKKKYGYRLFGHRMTYDDNLISTYHRVLELNQDTLEPDSSKIGFDTMEKINIPKVIDAESFNFSNVFGLSDNEVSYFNISYYLTETLNLLSIDEIIKKMPEDKRYIFKPIIDNKYKTLSRITSGLYADKLRYMIIGVAFNILNIPEKEREKYYNTELENKNQVLEYFKNKIKNPEFNREYIYYFIANAEREIDDLQRMHDIFVGNDKVLSKDIISNTISHPNDDLELE